MNNLIKITLLTFGFTLGAWTHAQNTVIPDEIKPFVEPNTQLLTYKAVDLNGDKRQDAIIVLEKPSNSNVDPFTEYPRTLIVLQRNSKGRLVVSARNNKIIQCQRCGGSQDPFVPDDAFNFGNKWFSITQESYGGTITNSTYTFQLHKDNRWYLKKFENNRTVNTKQGIDVVKKERRYPKDFSKITFARFNPVVFARRYQLNK